MKEISKFATITVLFTIGFQIAGCQAVKENNSAIATSQKEMLLTQAGFRFKDVTTPKQQQQVSQLAENKVSAVKYQGKLYYVYPTTKKDQILVGNQAQFNIIKQRCKRNGPTRELINRLRCRPEALSGTKRQDQIKSCLIPLTVSAGWSRGIS